MISSLTWSTSVIYQEGSGWITSVAPSSGDATIEPATVTVDVGREPLDAGLYHATILVSWNGGNAPVAILLDTDGDSDALPDWREQQIIDAEPNDNVNTLADVNPGDDFDGDGLMNAYEYETGSDPTDPESKVTLKGDINGDRHIDLTDVILALQVSVGIEPSSRIYTEADVNGDENIGLEEAVHGLQTFSDIRSE